MITSPEPWNYKIILGNNCLVDSQGNLVATFESYSDAEHVKNMSRTIRELEKEVERLEDRRINH